MYLIIAIKSIHTIMTITANAVITAIMGITTIMAITANRFITATIVIITNIEKLLDVAPITVLVHRYYSHCYQ